MTDEPIPSGLLKESASPTPQVPSNAARPAAVAEAFSRTYPNDAPLVKKAMESGVMIWSPELVSAMNSWAIFGQGYHAALAQPLEAPTAELPRLPAPAKEGYVPLHELYQRLAADQVQAYGLACYEAGRASGAQSEWQSMDSAPKVVGRIIGNVDGRVRFICWGKASHVPMYGWVLTDQGPEDCDLCTPSAWMPLPATHGETK